LQELTHSLDGMKYQIIIIDDGEDNTPQVINEMKFKSVLIYRRPTEEQNSLAGAIIQGFRLANAEFVSVMDGDGQHPADNIRRMYWKVETEKLDMVMASRYIDGGCNKGLDGRLRILYSSFLRLLPRIFFPKLRHVTDPLVGCFLIRSEALQLDRMKAIGWKVSLEVLLFSDIKTYGEIYYTFLPRIGGQSKAGITVGLKYFQQLASLVCRFYLHTHKGEQSCQQSAS
jgi:dolichol-phosphate mannosyltransferase